MVGSGGGLNCALLRGWFERWLSFHGEFSASHCKDHLLISDWFCLCMVRDCASDFGVCLGWASLGSLPCWDSRGANCIWGIFLVVLEFAWRTGTDIRTFGAQKCSISELVIRLHQLWLFSDQGLFVCKISLDFSLRDFIEFYLYAKSGEMRKEFMVW